jgi:uncharacterized protein (TIGR02145 family)
MKSKVIFFRVFVSVLFLSLLGCSKGTSDLPNHFTYAGIDYPLNAGILENYGSARNVYSFDLILYSSGISFSTVDETVDGTGNIVYLNPYSSSSSFATGTYTYDDGFTGNVGTFNMGMLGINLNMNTFSGTTVFISSGTVTVAKSGLTYEITINCKSSDNKIIDGYFKGGLTYYDNSIITDIDGNVYNKVIIGSQVWMKENLKATKLNDGTNIPLETNNAAWISLTDPAYCWYNNDAASYKDTYGALYNWFTIETSKLCPIGWHVPSDAEWYTLIDSLGGENIAGGKLKETGNAHWISPNTGATDEYGFTALPSGNRIGADGSFNNLGGYEIYWSSDESSYTQAINRVLVFDDTNFRIGYDNKTAGFSVRCIEDN